MKRILKIILIISLCIVAGFDIGYGLGKIFGNESVDNVQTNETAAWKDITLIVISSLLGVFVGEFLQLLIHEAGHLVCGLISGYKFVSFRVFNYTLFKDENKFKVKEFSLGGTAGQCLLTPPNGPVEKVPIVLYLLGGILFNLLLTALCITIAMWGTDNIYLRLSLNTIAFMGVYYFLVNGIPMTIGGFPNDGYSVLHLKGDLKAKSALLNILHTNALVQGGTQPRDLSPEYFAQLKDSNLTNGLETNLATLYLSVLIQRENFSEAENLCRRIIKESKVGLLTNEAKIELACILLNEGKIDEAAGLFDEKELKMIETSAKTQSSKQRFLFMQALKAKNDRQKAIEIYELVQSAKDKYLMKGEVAMDLELMWKALNDTH